MLNIYLIRHGETVWNKEGRLQGSIDIELSEVGLEQAAKTGEYLKNIKFDAIYSSDLQRAKKTAEIIQTKLINKSELKIDKKLQEIGYGPWEGLTTEDIIQKGWEKELALFEKDRVNNRPAGGELVADYFVRVNDAFNVIKEVNSNCNVLVVAHGGTIRGLISIALTGNLSAWSNMTLRNCSVSHIKVNKNTANPLVEKFMDVVLVGDTCHLMGNL